MQISPTDLRGMLHNDAVSLALCGLLLLAGLLALVVAGVYRRRAAPLLWISAFSYLYGFRLLIRTETFRLYLDAPQATWNYTEAAITYVVPIPIVLVVRAIFPVWRRFWTIGALGLSAFAASAIVSDAMLEQPFSAETANNLIAIAFFVGVLVWIFRPGLARSRELQTLRGGALAVAVTAVADNLRGMGILAFRGPDLEPFGFTVFIICLATVAVWRVIAEAERLVAMSRELEIARQIQSSILPQFMPRIPGLTIVARYRPMAAVAGDFYDFLEMDAQRLGILVADVSGHGVPAALIASMVKMALAAQRDHADRPAAVLTGMNETLSGRLAGQYVTAAYLFIDSRSRMIRYGAAGHPPMLRSTRGNDSVDAIEQNGLILGVVEGSVYHELEQPLCAATRFLLYTDGLIEAANADDDLFGLERLKSTLASAAGLPAQAVADNLLTTIDTWSGRPPSDDLTVVLADWVSED
jgi:sigma-B regulation protein RsbU (phosphoserine phosphatase)